MKLRDAHLKVYEKNSFTHHTSMLNIAFDVFLGTVFVKEIGILHFLQYKDYKNILLFALCLDMYFFYYSVIVLHHGDGRSTEFNFIRKIDSGTDFFL